MRWVLVGISAFMVLFTIFMQVRLGRLDSRTGAPVVYWVTDLNPARQEQVALFKEWLKKRGYPDIDLRLDVNNQGVVKTITQGTSGVAGDCIDTGNVWFGYYHNIGIVSPVTNLAAKFGYPDSGIFPGLEADLFVDGKQIAFPCNLGIAGYLVNMDTFRKLGLEPPSLIMDFDVFERLGKAFVERANRGRRRDTFFVGSLPQEALRRSFGVSYFNETLTRSAIKRIEFVHVLKLVYRWTFVEHLAPTSAEMVSFASEHGYGGVAYQMLANGYLGMVDTGRWALIQMRRMKEQHEWTEVVYPHGGYPNVPMTTRAVVMYAGSKNREMANYFLGFLRSEEYNMHIVNDGDGNPPNAAYMDREEFLRPVGRTNEWKAQAAFREIGLKYAIPRDVSPFALYQKYNRIENLAIQGYMNKQHSAETAVDMVDRAINGSIDSFVKAHPEIHEKYRQALARQKVIDEMKASSQKIPLAMIDNVFLRRYYKDKGLAE